MGDSAYTETVRVEAVHAAGVKVITVVPAEAAVTVPVLLTDATDGLLLLHVPAPPVERTVVVPLQMLAVPVMLYDETTVTFAVVWLPQGPKA